MLFSDTDDRAGSVDQQTITTGDTPANDDLWAEGIWSKTAPAVKDEPAPDLFERIWPLIPELRGFLNRRVPDGDIEDLLQDVLLRLCRLAEGVRVEHPRGYLYQVANAAIVDRHRRESSRCAALHCELSDAVHPVDELSPLRILLAREDVSAAEAALDALPERTREILIAMRLEGGTLKSLALRYAISTSAIEKHVTRAMKALTHRRADDWSLPALAPRRVQLDCYI